MSNRWSPPSKAVHRRLQRLVAAKDVLAALPGLPVIDAVANRWTEEPDGERAALGRSSRVGGAVSREAIDKPSGKAEPCMASRGSRYWFIRAALIRSPPVDLRDALERIGDDVMAGVTPSSARGILRRGGPEHATGADRLAARGQPSPTSC